MISKVQILETYPSMLFLTFYAQSYKLFLYIIVQHNLAKAQKNIACTSAIIVIFALESPITFYQTTGIIMCLKNDILMGDTQVMQQGKGKKLDLTRHQTNIEEILLYHSQQQELYLFDSAQKDCKAAVDGGHREKAQFNSLTYTT